jgi:hypothetical protein
VDRRLEDMDWDSTIGQWMKAVDIPDEGATLTVADVRVVEVRDNKARRDDAVKSAIALVWRESGWKPLLLNTTLKKVLRAMVGPTIGDVIGRPISLYNDQTVALGSARVGGVRILGAPWLDADMTIEVQPNPRKRPERITLRRTGPKRDVRPVEPPAETIEAWAARRGFALPAVDAALAAGGKPALASIPKARHPSAIAWLEGEGKLFLAQAADARTTTTTTTTTDTHQLGD